MNPEVKAKKPKQTKAQMRVRIAKDVLKQLDLGKIVPTEMTYLDGFHGHKYHADAREVVQQMPQCEACAKGAIFVAAVLRHNDAIVGECAVGFVGYLRRWFTAPQLRLIEGAFEDFGTTQAASAFYAAHEDPEMRMRAIMRNIIKNNGTFKP